MNQDWGLVTGKSHSDNTESREDFRKGREGRKEIQSGHGLPFANFACFAGLLFLFVGWIEATPAHPHTMSLLLRFIQQHHGAVGSAPSALDPTNDIALLQVCSKPDGLQPTTGPRSSWHFYFAPF